MNNAESVEINKGKVLVEKVHVTEFQKEGTQTAQLRQEIETIAYYASKQSSDSMTNSIYSNSDFGFKPQEFTSKSSRVAFINVPLGVSAEDVQKKIDENPDACIYRVMSNHPVLSDSQRYAINEGLTTKDKIANKQASRYGKGDDFEGQLILDNNGKVQYRRTAFSATPVEDIDRRTSDLEDFYVTPEIKLELGADIPDHMEVEASVNQEQNADTQGQSV